MAEDAAWVDGHVMVSRVDAGGCEKPHLAPDPLPRHVGVFGVELAADEVPAELGGDESCRAGARERVEHRGGNGLVGCRASRRHGWVIRRSLQPAAVARRPPAGGGAGRRASRRSLPTVAGIHRLLLRMAADTKIRRDVPLCLELPLHHPHPRRPALWANTVLRRAGPDARLHQLRGEGCEVRAREGVRGDRPDGAEVAAGTIV